MESQKQFFKKLRSNLISYLYLFFPPREIIYISQINSIFYKALSNDFIWESFAKTEDLFIPSERESFSRWKDYFIYLTKLKTNLKSGKASLSFKMTPYRGHKSVITAVLPIPMSNGPYSVIISGDEKGNVYTWNLDEDEDYEKVVICETGSSIVDIRLYNNDKVVFWNTENEFYLYEVNVQHYKNKTKIKNNGERFRLINHFTIDFGDKNIKIEQFQFDKDFTSIYVCSNFYDKYIFKDSHCIKLYSLITGKVIKIFDINYDINTKVKVRELNFQEDLNLDLIKYPNKKTSCFAINSNFLYTFSNYDLQKFLILSRYDQKIKLPNVFAYNIRFGINYSFKIELQYIFDVFILTHNSNVCFFGINKENQTVLMEFKHESNDFKLEKSIIISPNTKKVEFLSYYDNVMNFLIDNNSVSSIDMLKFSPKKTVTFDYQQDNKVCNSYSSDKYRFVAGFSNNLIKVFNIQTGQMWYNLLGGSMTIIPKSFISHPNYTGFHIIKLTRWSIVGVLGNLIREYSFKPTIKE